MERVEILILQPFALHNTSFDRAANARGRLGLPILTAVVALSVSLPILRIGWHLWNGGGQRRSRHLGCWINWTLCRR